MVFARVTLLVVVFVLARSCGTSTDSRTPAVPLTPESVQGCYELSLAKWSPDLGEDSVFATPPKRINLLGEKGSNYFESKGYLLRPAPGEQPSIHRSAYWRLEGTDKLILVWTTGFSGVEVDLHRQGDTLVGVAEPFWDFPRRGRKSKAVAQRIPCETSRPSRGSVDSGNH